MSEPKITKRLRDYGLITGQLPTGPRNLISDVAGVTVGHFTVTGPNRTGVTIISPSEANVFRHKLPAAVSVGNGYGKSVGTTQIVEFGQLETPIALTSTHGVAPVLQGLIDLVTRQTPDLEPYGSINAVVGETNDWILNDLHAQSLKPGDVTAAWDARTAEFALGAVGAGAGTRAFSWKGGIGSASRKITLGGKTYTIGTLVQTNYGGRLTILGVPVGSLLGAADSYILDATAEPDGSCMIITATDAPLSDRQLGRIAKRALFGLARTGSVMATGSGDYSLAFATQIPKTADDNLSDYELNEFFQATVEAAEESLYDALFTAETTKGRVGNVLHAFPVEKAAKLIKQYRRETV